MSRTDAGSAEPLQQGNLHMRTYFDVSLPYTAGLTRWLTAQRPVIVKTKDMSRGDRNNNSRIEAGVHHGTHIDAPLHFIADGKSIESLAPEILIGRVTVVALPDAGLMSYEEQPDAAVDAMLDFLL